MFCNDGRHPSAASWPHASSSLGFLVQVSVIAARASSHALKAGDCSNGVMDIILGTLPRGLTLPDRKAADGDILPEFSFSETSYVSVTVTSGALCSPSAMSLNRPSLMAWYQRISGAPAGQSVTTCWMTMLLPGRGWIPSASLRASCIQSWLRYSGMILLSLYVW